MVNRVDPKDINASDLRVRRLDRERDCSARGDASLGHDAADSGCVIPPRIGIAGPERGATRREAAPATDIWCGSCEPLRNPLRDRPVVSVERALDGVYAFFDIHRRQIPSVTGTVDRYEDRSAGERSRGVPLELPVELELNHVRGLGTLPPSSVIEPVLKSRTSWTGDRTTTSGLPRSLPVEDVKIRSVITSAPESSWAVAAARRRVRTRLTLRYGQRSTGGKPTAPSRSNSASSLSTAMSHACANLSRHALSSGEPSVPAAACSRSA